MNMQKTILCVLMCSSALMIQGCQKSKKPKSSKTPTPTVPMTPTTPTVPMTPTTPTSPTTPTTPTDSIASLVNELALPTHYNGQKVRYGRVEFSVTSSATDKIVLTAYTSITEGEQIPLYYDESIGILMPIPTPIAGTDWIGGMPLGISSDGNKILITGTCKSIEYKDACFGNRLFLYNRLTHHTLPIESDPTTYGGTLFPNGESILFTVGKSDSTELFKYDIATKKQQLLEKFPPYLSTTLISNGMISNDGAFMMPAPLQLNEEGLAKPANFLLKIGSKTIPTFNEQNERYGCLGSHITSDSKFSVTQCLFIYENTHKKDDEKLPSYYIVSNINTGQKKFINQKEILAATNAKTLDDTQSLSIIGIDNNAFSFWVSERDSSPLYDRKPTKRYFLRYEFETQNLKAYHIVDELAAALDFNTGMTLLSRSDVLIGHIDYTGSTTGNFYLQKINNIK